MLVDRSIEVLRNLVAENMNWITVLGNWPVYKKPEIALLGRVPTDTTAAPGFDAGIACCLGLIPADRQRLAATLHATYTEWAVEQVRIEAGKTGENLTEDSETTWWLAGCSVCEEGDRTVEDFLRQVATFQALVGDPARRLEVARHEFEKMSTSFDLIDGVPLATRDGGMQGAYIAGYDLAGWDATKEYGIYFIGTCRDTLGLEDFPWEQGTDTQGRPTSGPVSGSRQFVKAANRAEYDRAVAIARQTLNV